jgi:hypothetical protein
MEDSSAKSPTSVNHTIHCLPCQIEYDGAAPVSTYFLVSPQEKDTYVSRLRGRRLVGKEVKLPETVVGLHGIFGGKKSNTEGTIEIQESFRSFISWEHDITPDLNNIQECLDWMEIASVVS